jgi:hypothetical protein
MITGCDSFLVKQFQEYSVGNGPETGVCHLDVHAVGSSVGFKTV